MTQIDKTFPTLDCAACILTPKWSTARRTKKIHIYAYSEVEQVGGFVGNFHVKIRRKAAFVNEDVCTGCGASAEKCPQKKGPECVSTSGWTPGARFTSPLRRQCPRLRRSTPTTATCSKGQVRRVKGLHGGRD